jgi:hypothetical protein
VTSVAGEIKELQQSIGGEWVGAEGGSTFDDLDPFTGAVVARCL